MAGLAGCATTPAPDVLPYRFAVAGVVDARAADHDPLYDQYEFDAREMNADFSKLLAGSVFGGRDATLYLKLLRYRASMDNGSYALSMTVEGKALDDSTRPRDVGHFVAGCDRIEHGGVASLATYAGTMWQDRTLDPLTQEGRDRSMWHKAFDGCVGDLVTRFKQALLAKAAPAGTASEKDD
jgi:hypothetical protein